MRSILSTWATAVEPRRVVSVVPTVPGYYPDPEPVSRNSSAALLVAAVLLVRGAASCGCATRLPVGFQ
jgi:hypothetical protein